MSGTESGGGFSRIAKDKGSKRLLMFGGAAIVLAAGWAAFGGGTGPVEVSRVGGVNAAPDATQAAQPVTQQYGNALAQADGERVQRAQNTGQSALPTPVIRPVSDTLETPRPRDEQGAGWRPSPAPIVPTPTPTATGAPVQAPPAQQAQQQMRPQIDQNLLAAMQRQMQSLIPGPIQPAQTQYLYVPTPTEQAGAASVMPAGAALASRVVQGPGALPVAQTTVSSAAVQQRSRFAVPAPGTVIYSRLVGKVDSDVQGPVLGEVLQGPFAGSRLLGTFTFGERGVAIRFTSMTVPFKEDGEDRVEVVPINAVAVDTNHLGAAMATDIDRHLLERVGIAFATSFIEGMGQAIARSGAVVNQGLLGTSTAYGQLNTREQLSVGAGSAAGAAGRIMEQAYGNRRTTITVDADTPFGLLFLGSNNGN